VRPQRLGPRGLPIAAAGRPPAGWPVRGRGRGAGLCRRSRLTSHRATVTWMTCWGG